MEIAPGTTNNFVNVTDGHYYHFNEVGVLKLLAPVLSHVVCTVPARRHPAVSRHKFGAPHRRRQQAPAGRRPPKYALCYQRRKGGTWGVEKP